MPALITLRGARIEVGIVPELGGRVCHLRRPGRANLLLFDDALLGRRSRRQISFSPRARFVTLNGHTVWLGPQSRWWLQQDVNESRKRRACEWPPDPYLVRGAYAVLSQREDDLLLESPASPISGVRLRKRIRLIDDDTVECTAEAICTAESPVRWGLWLNTRVSGYARCRVLIASPDDVRIEAGEHPVASSCADGVFSFLPTKPRGDKCSAKAFIIPREPVIEADIHGQVLRLECPAVKPGAVARGQAPIEIYNACAAREADSLLELECHAAEKTLHPGQSMRCTQRWVLG